MADVQKLRIGVAAFHAETAKVVDVVSDLKWDIIDGYLQVVYRCILRRQHDGLSAILALTSQGHGHAAVPLLRPSCEELIWVKYLKSIDQTWAEQLVFNKAAIEVSEALTRQQEFAGSEGMQTLGLSDSSVTGSSERSRDAKEKLKVLGQSLGWEKGKHLPNASFMAQKTGTSALYKFMYHATSCAVHFNVHELLRRAWGRPGELSIRSIYLHDYWSAFALYWSLRLYLDTLIEVLDVANISDVIEGKGLLDEQSVMSAAAVIGDFGMVPIITAEELKWPE